MALVLELKESKKKILYKFTAEILSSVRGSSIATEPAFQISIPILQSQSKNSKVFLSMWI